MKRSSTVQDFIVTGFGLATSALVALILALIESSWNLAVYSFTVWFIFPIGAILAGLGGASGYYFGARLFHHRPTRLMLFNMISVAISTYFLINYLNYSWLQIDGQRVADAVPFSQYLDVEVTHQSLEFRTRYNATNPIKTGELGDMGYLVAVLQVLGFAVGGFGVYRYLQSIPYCPSCARYLSKQSTDERPIDVSGEDWKHAYGQIVGALECGYTQAARDALVQADLKKGSEFQIQLMLWKCVTCPWEYAYSSVNQWKHRNWEAVPGLTVQDWIHPSQERLKKTTEAAAPASLDRPHELEGIRVRTTDDALRVFEGPDFQSALKSEVPCGAELHLGSAFEVEGREWVEVILPDGVSGFALGASLRSHTAVAVW